MTVCAVETSPQLYARIGGALYLVIIVLGLFGEVFVRDRVMVSGDATATATNIRLRRCGASILPLNCFC